MRRNKGGALRGAGAQLRLRRVAAAAVRPVPAPEGRLPATYLTLWYQTTARRTPTGLQGTPLPSQPAAAAAGAAATRRSAALVHGVHAAEPPPLVAVARGGTGRLQALEAARIPPTTGLKTLSQRLTSQTAMPAATRRRGGGRGRRKRSSRCWRGCGAAPRPAAAAGATAVYEAEAALQLPPQPAGQPLQRVTGLVLWALMHPPRHTGTSLSWRPAGTSCAQEALHLLSCGALFLPTRAAAARHQAIRSRSAAGWCAPAPWAAAMRAAARRVRAAVQTS